MGANGDPKTEKGPPGLQMGTHVGAVVGWQFQLLTYFGFTSGDKALCHHDEDRSTRHPLCCHPASPASHHLEKL